jgi:hypothetical protein
MPYCHHSQKKRREYYYCYYYCHYYYYYYSEEIKDDIIHQLINLQRDHHNQLMLYELSQHLLDK